MCRILLTFLLLIQFCCSYLFAQNNQVKIDYIKLENAHQNWVNLKQNLYVNYDSLDESGIPQNLKIFSDVSLVTIGFSSNDSNTFFRYKLVGQSDKWSEISKKNESMYFKLPSGAYTFILQSYNNGTITDQTELKFEINGLLKYFYDSYFLPSIITASIILIYFSFKTAKLKKNQKLLEKTVRDRTSEIMLQKDEITLQKHLIEEKHREISDSINYAKRIQIALLTSQEYFDSITPENFIIWRPKDVVSGDFYWAYQLMSNNQEIIIWCAADCTGHGVPGAFMSMLGMSFLNEVVIENAIHRPDQILDKIRKKIVSALEQGNSSNIEQKDGMDMALCVWNKSTNELVYAGANNPVWIIRSINQGKGFDIIELKANRMPVGYYTEMKEFNTQSFQLQKGDTIYVFTDGIVDQFGGPDGKKFKSKKLKETLLGFQHLNMKDQALMINKEFDNWKGMNEQIDDLCMVGIKVN
ncbi:MAG: SpoIIE family protein phosphatase [Bacteroidia bacterium]